MRQAIRGMLRQHILTRTHTTHTTEERVVSMFYERKPCTNKWNQAADWDNN